MLVCQQSIATFDRGDMFSVIIALTVYGKTFEGENFRGSIKALQFTGKYLRLQ